MKKQFSINEIFNMLDEQNEAHIQMQGREMASQVAYLSFFFQPIEGKSLWKNCSVIISKKSDEELDLYIPKMFEWLQDMNWPGADIIYQRLLLFSYDKIKKPYELSVKIAEETKDEVWKEVLLDFWHDFLNHSS